MVTNAAVAVHQRQASGRAFTVYGLVGHQITEDFERFMTSKFFELLPGYLMLAMRTRKPR